MNERELENKLNKVLKESDDLDFYSTLDAPPPVSHFTEDKGRKKVNIKRISFIATAAVVLIVAVSGIAISSNNNSNDLLDPGKQAGQQQEKTLLTVDDFDDTNAMSEAYKIMPDLKVEERLFDDYMFEMLIIKKSKNETVAVSTYKNREGHEISVEQSSNSTLIKKD